MNKKCKYCGKMYSDWPDHFIENCSVGVDTLIAREDYHCISCGLYADERTFEFSYGLCEGCLKKRNRGGRISMECGDD